ncbi:Stk1 family PASTA domain-containing Ser/Thr kinase [Pseudonocardia sp. WMMC193]|uniref:Stk1 family PASTA domain-containing Ser/Thr kinase n=1 Tax=Pseudonocardia sp. WMMC193 TaxID=2911965 RepID=UPI001F0301D4|nr:Stk1 family PASTA domain-containing Ser/Thr kinase [Pseudonocardia sp. WMMC193]MCF7551906.1 Stk1 family PASTA domain-containing Ser/Thr kinase [Pseudonocardia sp. WMMC193]
MTTPKLLSERYQLGDTLGYGGMSEVHRGMDTRLGRDVAIKVLRADLARDPQFQLRFRREAQNAAALNHPAIVAVYDTGETQSEFGPLPYIVMEFVDGQTLREIVKSTGPLSQQRVIEVMADVCAALDFSHRHNIIHRDVKPANIMITRNGAVKVMDFGIARALGEGQNVTQTAAVIGTAQYLSPEQARGEQVDARSDVYAAGCVLFELLTGEPPFTGDTPVAVAYQHVREDPRRPSDVNPQIPPALDAVILKALSKNPVNRYQSAAEMRADLIRVRNGQQPLAPMVMSEDERTALLAEQTAATRRISGGGRHAPAAVQSWEDEDPPKRTGRTIGIVVAVLAVLGLLGFGAYALFGPNAQPAQVAVPQVAGQDPDAARAAITNAGLLADLRQEPSEVAQTGKVTRTDPGSGVQVAERTRVTIYVGTGPASATVPALTGKTVQEAQTLLEQRGLKLGEQSTQETSDSSQIGKIIQSTPAAGVDAPGGSPVAVVVGTKQTTVQVPDVTGQSEDQAKQTLAQSGFTQVQTQQVDGGGQQGTVVQTNPSAGTRVAPGTTITLSLSRGNQVQVPNVVGKSASEAVQELNAAGLRNYNLTGQQVQDQSQNNVVISTSPSAGSSMDPDDEVTVVVGQFRGNGFGNNN